MFTIKINTINHLFNIRVQTLNYYYLETDKATTRPPYAFKKHMKIN